MLQYIYSRHLKDPQAALEAMLKPKITALPGHIQSVYVQNILKLYSNILKSAESEGNTELMQEMGKLLQEKLPLFVQSADLEVQERVRKCFFIISKRMQKYLQ